MFKIEYDSTANGWKWLIGLFMAMPTERLGRFSTKTQDPHLGFIPAQIVALGNPYVRRHIYSGPYMDYLKLFKNTFMKPEHRDRFNPTSEATAMQDFLELDPEWMPLLERTYIDLRRLRYMYVIDPMYFLKEITILHTKGYKLALSSGSVLKEYRHSAAGYSSLSTSIHELKRLTGDE